MYVMTSGLFYASCALFNVATAHGRDFSPSASNDGEFQPSSKAVDPLAPKDQPPLPGSGIQSLLKISLDVVDVFQAH